MNLPHLDGPSPADDTIGLYLHLPFCDGKCPYCDFYSFPPTEGEMDRYADALERELERWAARTGRRAHSLFLGGGTPTLLGARRLQRLVEATRRLFLTEDAEITCEANPRSSMEELLQTLAAVGVNRMSFGLQSSNEEELLLLGRRHTAEQARRAVEAARRAGISNLSLDLMLCLPGQTVERVRRSIDFCLELEVPHVSAYMLKVEAATPFAAQGLEARMPDEEIQRSLYLEACRRLENGGLRQYEISNFARPGAECRHNLTYWDDGEYLGVGAGAHSFLDGRRFYYERDAAGFCLGQGPVDDGPGGDFTEYAMLRLRLCEGLREEGVRRRFDHAIPEGLRRRAQRLAVAGLAEVDSHGVRLTRDGFLVSNAAIGMLLAD